MSLSVQSSTASYLAYAASAATGAKGVAANDDAAKGSSQAAAVDGAQGAAGQPDATEQNFLDYARMSVAERIRKHYLEKAGMTEEQLGQLDADARAKIEEEIRNKVRESLHQAGGKDSGTIANIVV
ncbi:hypothetical protein [Ferrovibrio sp.]|uniref:hypothetical protein n=1 Tax=Ferrovibrio sp. TaxID=1917215 RepID=UPI003D0E1266